jgi:hypothetical protein
LEEEKMKKQNGFTLIELLTMTAIILLLVSIFLPSLQNVERHSNSAACLSYFQNDITLSPVELILISPDGISGRPTIVGKFLAWEQIPENPDPYDFYGLNLWICDNRCLSDTCWISHNCINQSADNAKWILTDLLVNKIDQKQSAR